MEISDAEVKKLLTGTFKERWEEFLHACYPGPAPIPAFQIEELRRAYYSGAFVLLVYMNAALHLKDEELCDFLDEREKEILEEIRLIIKKIGEL